MTTFLTEKK
jgi:hypothetical protein